MPACMRTSSGFTSGGLNEGFFLHDPCRTHMCWGTGEWLSRIPYFYDPLTICPEGPAVPSLSFAFAPISTGGVMVALVLYVTASRTLCSDSVTPYLPRPPYLAHVIKGGYQSIRPIVPDAAGSYERATFSPARYSVQTTIVVTAGALLPPPYPNYNSSLPNTVQAKITQKNTPPPKNQKSRLFW